MSEPYLKLDEGFQYSAASAYSVDEVLAWPDIWFTAHVWAAPEHADRVSWLNFRLIPHESQGGDGPEPAPFYPTETECSPSRDGGTMDARAAKDWMADGFLKWDGCMEIGMDHHFCGAWNVRQFTEALSRLLKWAGKAHGFEDCE